MKNCPKCNTVKSSDKFSTDKRTPAGLKSWCKDCNNKLGKDYYLKNKAKIDERNKAWHRNNPEASRRCAYNWKSNNLEKVKLYRKNWDQKNKEKISEQKKAWRAANKEKDRLYGAVRRIRQKENGIFLVTTKDIESLLSKPCLYCDKPAESIDHITPIARGGRHSIGNLAPACMKCNQSKNSRLLIEWKLSRVE